MDNNLRAMRVLIIGYGSIGKKHFKIIKKNFKKINLFILSKRKISVKGAKIFNSLKEIKDISFNYVIVASEPHEHYKHLQFFEKNFKNLKILVEKPLFNKEKKFIPRNNEVHVGYNLRFHPAIDFIKNFLKNNRPIEIKLITNSFLPNWRKSISHKNYSVSKKKGGGVILDLSHEIDLVLWLFGKISIDYVKFNKVSKLKIKTEDFFQMIGKVGKCNLFLNLSYYSKNEIRNIFIDTNKKSLFVDLKNNMIRVDNKLIKVSSEKYDIDKTYLNLHRAIILGFNKKKLCSIKNGREIMKIIGKIKNPKKLKVNRIS